MLYPLVEIVNVVICMVHMVIKEEKPSRFAAACITTISICLYYKLSQLISELSQLINCLYYKLSQLIRDDVDYLGFFHRVLRKPILNVNIFTISLVTYKLILLSFRFTVSVPTERVVCRRYSGIQQRVYGLQFVVYYFQPW